jgi:hypothetical protein
MMFAPHIRLVTTSLAGLLAFSLCGCVEFDADLHVAADGSGTLQVESWLHQTRGNTVLLTALAGLGGDPKALKDPVGDLYSRASFEAMAAQLGEEVTLESASRLTRADGTKGARATYRFPDVTAIRVGPQLIAAPLRRLGFEPMDWSYTFRMRDMEDGSKELYIFPPDRSSEKGLSLREALRGGDRMPGFDKLLADAVRPARIAIDLTVDGQVSHTNSSYLHKPSGRGVTLLNLPVKNIIAHSGVDPLKDFSRLEDIEALRKADLPGVKVESVTTPIGVRFK